MKLHDLEVLKKNPNEDNLYDLTEKTYTNYITQFFEYTVLPEEDMRIDLVSISIYDSVDYADLIMSVNEIINPLSIRAGDKLIYPDDRVVDYFRVVPPNPPDLGVSPINPARANIKDPRRLEFIQNNFQLPPTLLPYEQTPIRINRDNITIRPLS